MEVPKNGVPKYGGSGNGVPKFGGQKWGQSQRMENPTSGEPKERRTPIMGGCKVGVPKNGGP